MTTPGGGSDVGGDGPGNTKALDAALDAIEAAARAQAAPVRAPQDASAPGAIAEASGEGRPRRRKDKPPRRPRAKAVVLGVGEDIELWRDRLGDGYGSFVNAVGVREHAPIASRSFQNHLRLKALEASGEVPSASAIDDVVRVHAARALSAPIHMPLLRTGFGPDGETILLDKGDASGTYFEITRHGFQARCDGRPKFLRRRGMGVLVEPEPGSTIRSLLKPLINSENEDGFTLCVAWLLAALRPVGPYPVLLPTGEQGVGKSVVTRLLRRLVDPSEIEIAAPPRDLRDFLIVAMNSHVVAIDNVSKLDAELSDAMCRLSTGGGSRTRTLHTDSDETLFMGSRPQICNGIGNLAERGDLADRALVIRLKAIADTERRCESDFWRDFAYAEPAILGALFTAVSFGLKNLSTTRLDRAPRLADFARWIVACEPGLGDDWAPGSFLRALESSRADARHAAYEADVVAMKLEEFVRVEKPEGWCGTATELLTLLSARASDDLKRRRDWPFSAQGLGNRLDRCAPLLRARGLVVERHHSGVRKIILGLKADHKGDDA